MSRTAKVTRAASKAALARPTGPRRADVVGSYDRGVRVYEALWSPVILPPAVAMIQLLGLTSRCVVADVGAGTGALLGAVRAAAPGARVVALDASAGMLAVAARRGAPAIRADALALPLADRAADAARALTEAARVLRPGGRLAALTWAWERGPAAQAVWDEALADAGMPPAPLRRVDAGLNRPDVLAATLRTAGLRPDRAWPVRLEHRWDRWSFWERCTGSGVTRLRLSMVGAASRDRALARARDSLDRLDPEDFWWEGEVISHLVGHSSTCTTERVYRHELRPVLRTGAERMGRIFSQRS